MVAYTLPFEQLGMKDVDIVGGKNASLGEMISHLAALGVKVPTGFATTAEAYREFLQKDGLAERISATLLSRFAVQHIGFLQSAWLSKKRLWCERSPVAAN